MCKSFHSTILCNQADNIYFSIHINQRISNLSDPEWYLFDSRCRIEPGNAFQMSPTPHTLQEALDSMRSFAKHYKKYCLDIVELHTYIQPNVRKVTKALIYAIATQSGILDGINTTLILTYSFRSEQHGDEWRCVDIKAARGEPYWF